MGTTEQELEQKLGRAREEESVRYEVRTDRVTDEEGSVHLVYGVSAYGEKGRLLQSVPNVFCDLAMATDFVDACNRFQLCPIHLMDVIEDTLSDPR